ncbi:MAG: tyrosine-protein phosphatase [Dysgonomonas sp.]
MNKATYTGNDLSDKVYITRDKTTKQASLVINIPGKWELYSGSSVDNIDFSKSIAKGDSNGTYSLNVNDTARSYFQIVTEQGCAILAERHLPMTGGYNFRDLGGFKTTDGKYVKWGKVFRSDDLNKLTDADLKYLNSIPLISIIDFRSPSEIKLSPDKMPRSTRNNYAFSITPGNLSSIDDIKNMTTDQINNTMKSINQMLVTDSSCIAQYRLYFDLLQDEAETPLMFHCSAGKDRTGMGAALFLYSLGVDEKTILNDYLSSNKYLGDKYKPILTQHPNLKPLLEVDESFLKAGIEQIKKDHGSIENYLTNILNVDLNKMRQLYLYDE